MKISVVMANYNGEKFLEESLKSVISQREDGVDLEFIVMDGASTDGSTGILKKYERDIDVLVSEKDDGPADAIAKGLRKATGDVVCWLNADDCYYPGALKRVAEAMESHPDRAICFGHCPIVDEQGHEIRRGITRFKEMFFPISGRFTIQCINYISQPATFFRRSAWEKIGQEMRTEFVAAWDYDLWLRLWHHGGAVRVKGAPLSFFRWHEASISGQHFRKQFREEWLVTVEDCGRFSLQSIIHLGVRLGIVGCYGVMAKLRSKQ